MCPLVCLSGLSGTFSAYGSPSLFKSPGQPQQPWCAHTFTPAPPPLQAIGDYFVWGPSVPAALLSMACLLLCLVFPPRPPRRATCTHAPSCCAWQQRSNSCRVLLRTVRAPPPRQCALQAAPSFTLRCAVLSAQVAAARWPAPQGCQRHCPGRQPSQGPAHRGRTLPPKGRDASGGRRAGRHPPPLCRALPGAPHAERAARASRWARRPGRHRSAGWRRRLSARCARCRSCCAGGRRLAAPTRHTCWGGEGGTSRQRQ